MLFLAVTRYRTSCENNVGGTGRRLEEPFGVVVVDPDPLHAGVDLEVHPGGGVGRRRRRLDVPQPREGRGGEGQAVVEEQRDLMSIAHLADGPEVRHGHRLAATRVVGE